VATDNIFRRSRFVETVAAGILLHDFTNQSSLCI